jgi:hypothetical protein
MLWPWPDRFIFRFPLSQEKLDDISGRLLQSMPHPPPKKAPMQLTQQIRLSYNLTLKAVKKKLKLFPNKVSTVQQHKDADYY